jgi:hypothetical protein
MKKEVIINTIMLLRQKGKLIWIVEMMVMALGETCWNNKGGYH